MLVGLALTYTVSLPPESRKYEVGTPPPGSSSTLPTRRSSTSLQGVGHPRLRANLLANLMTEGDVKARIARRPACGPVSCGPASSTGELPAMSQVPRGAADAHLLTTRLESNSDGVPLPMIELEAQAPDPASRPTGERGGHRPRSYLDSKAATEDYRRASARVTGLGEPQVREAVRGPRHLVALGAALFVFLCGCAAILIVPAIARRLACGGGRRMPRRPRARPRQSAGSRHRDGCLGHR